MYIRLYTVDLYKIYITIPGNANDITIYNVNIRDSAMLHIYEYVTKYSQCKNIICVYNESPGKFIIYASMKCAQKKTYM